MRRCLPARPSLDARTLLAHHEAGHAILAAVLDEAPHRVSIVGDATTLGHTHQRALGGSPELAQIYLAGFAAEHILTGRRPRQLDQELRFAILALNAKDLLAAFAGSEQRDGHRAVQHILRTTPLRGSDELLADVARYYQAARASLVAVWAAVQSVAAALLEREVLDRDAVLKAIGRCELHERIPST